MTNQLAKIDTTQYLAVKREDLVQIMEDNFGDGLAPEFDRVKFPSSGAQTFTLPGVEGEETAPVLAGVVIAHHVTRAYWAAEYSGGTPPNCSSLNGKVGQGDPGGVCSDCPLNQYGTALKGEGKACKEMHRVYLLRPGETIPIILRLPPTSIKNFQRYATGLLRKNLSLKQVVTAFGLGKDKNKGGITYSKAEPTMVKLLEPEAQANVRGMAEELVQYITTVPVNAADYNVSADYDVEADGVTPRMVSQGRTECPVHQGATLSMYRYQGRDQIGHPFSDGTFCRGEEEESPAGDPVWDLAHAK